MLLILMPYVTSFLYFDYHFFLVPFTNWTLIISTIALGLSIIAGVESWLYGKHAMCKSREAFYVQASHHLILTFSLIMNILVVPIYWIFLHK